MAAIRGRSGGAMPANQPPPAHQNPPYQLPANHPGHQSVSSSGGYPGVRVNGNGANGTVTPVVPQQGPSQQGPTQMLVSQQPVVQQPILQAGGQSLSAPWNPQVQQSASYPQAHYIQPPPQMGAASTSSGQQLVITDPNRLVPVQITIPAQPGNPTSQPRQLTVQVPAHALQQSGQTAQILQNVLTQAITQALTLPESHAAVFLQTQINNTFKLST